MIGNHYQAHKHDVIDLFERYKDKRGNINDGVDINFLTSRIDSLKNSKFTLVVAGEVKAGKSTFINALLGAEVLPSDVLQASSAIVEIFKSENPFLKVKYADGKQENIPDDFSSTQSVNAAKDRLHNICSISEEYRGIPTTLIDEHIIDSTTTLEVNQDFVSLLEQQSGENLEGKTEQLETYINNRSKSEIPVEIDFGYPLKWKFDELRIVDSPGVNAVGGVQDVSFQFFKKANAILFVHPIRPIESESFKKFVNSVISNRSKETLFLVLTHAGLHSDSDVDKLHSEAIRLYEEIIPEERILVVDSLLKLIHDDFENGKTQEEIEDSSEQKDDILPKFEKKAKKQGKELKSILLEHSRFEEMFSAIDDFSMEAPNLQLREILESIKAGYSEQESQYGEKIQRLNDKKRNPQEFEAAIVSINNALEKYKLLMNQTTDDLTSNYSGRHSNWQKDIDKLKEKYSELITESDSLESVRKNTVDAMNEIQDIVNLFSSELTRQLRIMLDETGRSFKNKYKISLPKVDLSLFEIQAKSQAYKQEDVYKEREVDGWDVVTLGISWLFRDKRIKSGKTKTVLDEKQYLEGFQNKCKSSFFEIVNKLPSQSKEVLNSFLDLFSREMKSAIEDRQEALKAEKDKQQTNKEIIHDIKQLEGKKKAIQPEKELLDEVLTNL